MKDIYNTIRYYKECIENYESQADYYKSIYIKHLEQIELENASRSRIALGQFILNEIIKSCSKPFIH